MSMNEGSMKSGSAVLRPADAKSLRESFQLLKGKLQEEGDKLSGPNDMALTGQIGTPVLMILAMLDNLEQRLRLVEDGSNGGTF